MGLYRLLLALGVLISHTALAPKNLDVGISAVVSFFILSGLAMTYQIERFGETTARVGLFYIDRAVRIFPQYLFYLALAMVLLGSGKIAYSFASDCGSTQIAFNLLVIPMGWADAVGVRCFYLPQAWSLGLELCFYLILPWLAFYPRACVLAAVLSCCVFGAAFVGLIDSEVWGYRTLPGTLFIFMVGMTLARGDLLVPRFALMIWLGAVALLATHICCGGVERLMVDRDVTIGLVVGIPSIALAHQLRQTRLDKLCGNMSYGVFLNHLICMNILEQIVGLSIDSCSHLLILIAFAVSLSFLTCHFVEKPSVAFRRGLRAIGRNLPDPLSVPLAATAPKLDYP